MIRVLAIDACLGRCSAAVVEGKVCLGMQIEEMARGHAERLPVVVRAVLDEAAVLASEIDLVATSIGPGGFTGARLGVAFARGLSLATGAACVGVTTLEALAWPHRATSVLVALDGRRENVFVQPFTNGQAVEGPHAIPRAELPELRSRFPDHAFATGAEGIDPRDVAACALAGGWRNAPPPAPLYLRGADAIPARAPVLTPAAQ